MQFLSLKSKLLLSCIVISIVLTLLLSVFETSKAHRAYIKDVEQEFLNIETIHREYLTKKMWAMEFDSLIAFANEEVSENKVDNFRVTDTRGVDIVHAGEPLMPNSSVHQFDLPYYYKDKTVNIGKVFIGSNVPSYNEWFLSRWQGLLLVNGFLVVVIFFISYFVFYKQVLTRLSAIKEFSEKDVFNSTENDKLLTGSKGIPDEITLLANTLVERRNHIRKEYQRRVKAEHELIDKNTALSLEVEERQRVERALQASKNKYQLLVDSQTDLLIKIDLEGRFEFVSQSYCKMFGETEDTLLSKSSMMFVHPDDQLITEKAIQKILLAPHEGILEQRVNTINGWRWLAWTGAGVFDKQRDLIAIIGTGRDITEQKNAELKLEQSQAEFQAIFSSITDALVFVNTDREILMINPAFTKIFGYSFAEAKNKTTEFLYANKSSYHELTEKRYSETAGSNNPIYENEYRKKDGSFFIAETLGVPVKNAKGEFLGFLGIIRDITDKKQEEKEKESLENRLRQSYKMEAIGTLAGGIAHDFNNILSAVLGFTELALAEVGKSTPIEEDLREVHSAGLRAKDLVNQILTFSRQSDEELGPIQIDYIAKEVFKFIRSSIPTSIELKQEITSSSLIMGNATQIHQILMNLCTNAAHAMEQNGGILEISLKDVAINKDWPQRENNLQIGRYVEIKVSDTGHGMETHILEKIFDPYFTTKKQGEGTGIGLSLVHGIVETYGGKIFVESTLDKGTVCTIYLPVCNGNKVDLSSKTEKLPHGGERILFIDDEISIAQIGSRMLSSLGYSVTTKTSSLEALDLYRSNPDNFDLIISDVTMPEMTGDKLASEILSIKPDTPIILCTGYSKNLSNEKTVEIGIKSLVSKPIVKADLASTVRRVLDEANGVTNT